MGLVAIAQEMKQQLAKVEKGHVMRHELQGLIDALEGKTEEYAGIEQVVEEGDEDD